ncbi:tol-pal system protein YbgF [Hyphococcus lacteus]|uniref:Cell division coordinator CpoB n=1 Tax=Hyphococcus lacteus TaxID=3143536 RepID=A0ABV3Z4L3_9PROT
MRIRTGMIALIGAVALAGPALGGTKDDVRDLQARMMQAEQAIANQSAMMVRVSELESRNQQLTGRIEELTYKLEQANQRLDAVTAALSGGGATGALGDTAMSGDGLGDGPVDLMGGASGAALGSDDPIGDQIARETAVDQAGSVGGGDVSLPIDPNAAFDYASGFLLAGDYQRAKAAFSLYLEAFPNHQRTPDAQFRLGEIHLALGENAAAADAFIAHIRNYPNNTRAAEAYLKLGTAFARLDKTSEACTVFKTMKSKHPNAPSAVVQRTDLEMARIDCK